MTLKVHVVQPEFLHYVWKDVEPMLARGLAKSGGEYSVDHLKVYIVQAQHTLLIATDSDNKIHGAWTIRFNDYPNDRVAFVTAVGGKALIDQDAWSQFTDWCRLQGATVIRGWAVESVARLWRKSFGVQSPYVVVEKRL